MIVFHHTRQLQVSHFISRRHAAKNVADFICNKRGSTKLNRRKYFHNMDKIFIRLPEDIRKSLTEEDIEFLKTEYGNFILDSLI